MRHAQLEAALVQLVRISGAQGGVLVLLQPNDRVEFVAAAGPEQDLAGKLQKVVDSLRDGDGMPIGGHGQTIGETKTL
jgi:hypothetical protein